MLLQEALDAAWEEKLVRLEAYKAVHGDCNVPLRWADDKQLGKWVVHQRGRKRKLDRGEPSKGMTAARAAKLDALGFAWDPPRQGGKRGKTRQTRTTMLLQEALDAAWEEKLVRLEAYKAAFAGCCRRKSSRSTI